MQLAIVIDLGGTNIKFGLCDISGNLVYEGSEKTEGYLGKDSVLVKLIAIIDTLIQKAVSNGNTVLGVGFGSPGIIDSTKKTLVGLGNNIKGWSNINFEHEIGAKTKLPIYVENDANLAAFGEFHYGETRGVDNFILVTLGTGIGGGIVKNQRIFHGANYTAGEFGHTIVNFKGRNCSCGQKGCWETYASCVSFQSDYKRNFSCFKSASQILDEYFNESMSYREKCFVEEYFDYVAFGLINIVYSFNPHHLLLGGGLSDAHPQINAVIDKRIKSLMSLNHDEEFFIGKASLGNKAALLGGAALVFNK